MFSKKISTAILTVALSISTCFLFGQTYGIDQANPKTPASTVDGGGGSNTKSSKAVKPNAPSKSNVKTVNKKKRKTTQVTSVKTQPAPKKAAPANSSSGGSTK